MPTATIIGASRGIGLGLVRQYAADGWRVHATTRTPGRPGALGDIRGDVHIHELEVADRAQQRALAAALAGEAIDVLIHNAGVYGTLMRAATVNRINAEAPVERDWRKAGCLAVVIHRGRRGADGRGAGGPRRKRAEEDRADHEPDGRAPRLRNRQETSGSTESLSARSGSGSWRSPGKATVVIAPAGPTTASHRRRAGLAESGMPRGGHPSRMGAHRGDMGGASAPPSRSRRAPAASGGSAWREPATESTHEKIYAVWTPACSARSGRGIRSTGRRRSQALRGWWPSISAGPHTPGRT